MTRYLTGREVAERLGVSPVTIRSWRVRGQGPPYSQAAGKGTQAVYDPQVVAMWAKLTKRGGRNDEDE